MLRHLEMSLQVITALFLLKRHKILTHEQDYCEFSFHMSDRGPALRPSVSC